MTSCVAVQKNLSQYSLANRSVIFSPDVTTIDRLILDDRIDAFPVILEAVKQVNRLDLVLEVGGKVDRPVHVLPAERVVSHVARDVIVIEAGPVSGAPGPTNTLPSVSVIGFAICFECGFSSR